MSKDSKRAEAGVDSVTDNVAGKAISVDGLDLSHLSATSASAAAAPAAATTVPILPSDVSLVSKELLIPREKAMELLQENQGSAEAASRAYLEKDLRKGHGVKC